MKYLLFIVTCTILTACSPINKQWAHAKHDYQQQDYRQTFLRLKRLAKTNDVKSQYALGYMYYYGKGTLENRSLALFWMHKAAAAGHAGAQRAIALIRAE